MPREPGPEPCMFAAIRAHGPLCNVSAGAAEGVTVTVGLPWSLSSGSRPPGFSGALVRREPAYELPEARWCWRACLVAAVVVTTGGRDDRHRKAALLLGVLLGAGCLVAERRMRKLFVGPLRSRRRGTGSGWRGWLPGALVLLALLVAVAWGAGGSGLLRAENWQEVAELPALHWTVRREFDASLGFPGEGPSPGAAVAKLLKVATLNVTCWNSWEAAATVEQEQAAIWLLQEHKITCELRIEGIRRFLGKKGFSTVFGPGIVTDKGGSSCGTAILMNHHCDVLERYKAPARLGHRAAGARVRAAGVEFQLWSVYGCDRDRLVTQELLKSIVAGASAEAPLLIGGDFNATPGEVQQWLAE